MEVCGVYIEKIENKGRALWVLGVFAREKKGIMLAHACAQPLAAAGRGTGSGLGLGPGPNLDWFFLNRVSGYGPNRSAPLHYPIRSNPPTGVRATPGLVLFESGFRVWAEQIRPTPLPNPLQPANGCPRDTWTGSF